MDQTADRLGEALLFFDLEAAYSFILRVLWSEAQPDQQLDLHNAVEIGLLWAPASSLVCQSKQGDAHTSTFLASPIMGRELLS
eukprot:1161963-Pelagomonas_calceolata.AAC.5